MLHKNWRKGIEYANKKYLDQEKKTWIKLNQLIVFCYLLIRTAKAGKRPMKIWLVDAKGIEGSW